MGVQPAFSTTRAVKKRPKRKRPIPNAAVRRAKSPRIPVNVEMMHMLALERVAARFAQVVATVIYPHVVDFAFPEREERTDANTPSPKTKGKPKPGSPADILRRQMAYQGTKGGDVLSTPADIDEDLMDSLIAHGTKAARKLMEHARKQVHEGFDEPELRKSAFVAAERTEKHSKREFKRLGIDVRKEPPLGSLIEDWRHENVALITKMQDDQLDKIEGILRDGWGHRAETLAKQLEAQVEDVPRSRARLIARDQVLKLNAKITKHRQKAAGINSYVWTTSMDERVRPAHEELEGEVFSWDGEGDPEEGHPGDAVQCLPGDARITLPNAVCRLYRRWYRGELTTLVASNGEAFSATPNHPVLTSRGWKVAQAIDVGDYVFEAKKEVLHVSEVNAEDVQPNIAQMFNALSVGGVLLRRTRGVRAQFHGDGIVDEQVDIVDMDRSLLLDAHPDLAKRLCEIVLSKADSSCARSRSLELGFQALNLPTSRAMRVLCLRLAQFERRLSKAGSVGLAPIPRLDAATLDEVLDGLSSNIEALCERLHRGTFPIEVEAFLLREMFGVCRRSVMAERLHTTSAECLGEIVAAASKHSGNFNEQHPALKHPLRIVEKSVRVFEGHVFNLETTSGWYGANSLLNSNCRCIAYPLLDDEFLDGG